MRQWNPIQNEQEFKGVCKSSLEPTMRILDYVIADLDTGWRNLTRRETEIRKHQLKFLEELQTQISNAATGTLNTGVRF